MNTILLIVGVILKLTAAFFLFISGLLLFFESSNQQKKSVKYWGLGLLLLSIISLSDIFIYPGDTQAQLALYAIRRVLIEIALILLMMHGTLLLLVPKKHAKYMIYTYFIAALVVDFTINKLMSSSILMNLATHHIYVTLPLSIVSFSYFYTYHLELHEKSLLKLGLGWGALFIVSMIMIITAGLGIEIMMEIAHVTEYLIIIYIAFAFDDLRKSEDHIWHKVTTPKSYVVDSNILNFLNDQTGKNCRSLIEIGLKKQIVEDI